MLLASHIFEALCVNVPLLVPRDCEAAMCPLSVITTFCIKGGQRYRYMLTCLTSLYLDPWVKSGSARKQRKIVCILSKPPFLVNCGFHHWLRFPPGGFGSFWSISLFLGEYSSCGNLGFRLCDAVQKCKIVRSSCLLEGVLHTFSTSYRAYAGGCGCGAALRCVVVSLCELIFNIHCSFLLHRCSDSSSVSGDN